MRVLTGLFLLCVCRDVTAKTDCTDVCVEGVTKTVPLEICDQGRANTNVGVIDYAKIVANAADKPLGKVKQCIKKQCEDEDTPCTADTYAPFDGRCNNLGHPSWGTVGERQHRLISPVYNGGFESARLNDINGVPLPDVRTISNEVLKQTVSDDESDEFTLWVMAFSQFIDHDISLTPKLKYRDGNNIDCCTGTYKDCESVCLPIHPGPDDPHFGVGGVNQTCINFVRSESGPCCRSRRNVCTPRTPLNNITPYLDGTPTYGSSDAQAKALRATDGSGAALATLVTGSVNNEGSYLCPNADQSIATCLDGGTLTGTNAQYCFKSGDSRMHVVPSLSAIITLFTREHNRIVGKLRTVNGWWDEERLYQEARKIVMAQYQMFAIRDLTADVTLDDTTATNYGVMESTGFHDVYNNTVPAQASVGFTTAGYRFGHGLINSLHGQINKDYTMPPLHDIPLEELYNRVKLNFDDDGISGVLRYATKRGMFPANKQMAPVVRNLLFLDLQTNVSLDLAALNLQRGRDHGLPDYNSWRAHFGLEPFPADHDSVTANLIRDVYGNRNSEIDLFVGGMTENLVPGALVGKLFAEIIGEQFQRLKTADRFYYQNTPDSDTNKGRFQTEDQVESIQQLKMSNLICQNTDTVNIQEDIFRIENPTSNPLKTCTEIEQTDIDFNLWFEAQP